MAALSDSESAANVEAPVGLIHVLDGPDHSLLDPAVELLPELFAGLTRVAPNTRLGCSPDRTRVLGPGLLGVILAVGLINWAGFARIVRGEVLVLREKEFVAAARALAKSDLHIMVRHLLPNVMGSALVMGSYYVAVAIIVEASLSFIGMGAQEPLPSLGKMINEGRGYMLLDHWISTIPGLAIVILVLGLNAFGDGLRDVLDPRLRGER